MISRRELMRAAVAAAVLPRRAYSQAPPSPAPKMTLCFFSKHLPELGWSDLGKAVKESGFDGVDLTVRAAATCCPSVPPTISRGRSMPFDRTASPCR